MKLQRARQAPRSQHERDYLLQKKVNRIWTKAAPLYGASNAKAPKIWEAPGLDRGEAESVYRGQDSAKRTGIKFSPKLATALLNLNSNLHNTALETVLHETEHQYQNPRPVTPKDVWEVEGGAEARARAIAPKVYKELGITYHNPRFNGYPGYTKEVRAKKGQRWVSRGQLKPIFSEESAANEGPAYRRNVKHAKPSATGYQTQLDPKQEAHFREWLRNSGNPGEFNPESKRTPYDMRGYWLHLVKTGRLQTGQTKHGHFPDAYKTPYDPSFSRWSKYAAKGTPLVWRKGNRLVNRKTGRVVFEER